MQSIGRWINFAQPVASILLDLFLLTILAAFKSAPLIGFHIARRSIIILVVSWLALIVISLSTPKDKN